MNQNPLKVVRGSERSILNSQPMAGYLWFALDTRKIYYSDQNSFISMGGNSGFYYGNLEFAETPDSDQKDFVFTFDDIDGDNLPNENDLILNIPDGCFYRVQTIEYDDNNNPLINTIKLTIAGSGGGGGGGGASGSVILRAINTTGSTTVYCVDDQDTIISFNVNSTAEDDIVQTIIYKIGTNGSIATVVDEEGHEMGEITFNLKPYIASLSTATSTSLSVVIIDSYGLQKTLTYILNRVSISLTEDSNLPPILQASNYELEYECTPLGGGGLLNKKIVYDIYDENHIYLTSEEHSFSSSNIVQRHAINFRDIDGIGIGSYYVEIKYIGYTTETSTVPVESNVLSHLAVSYDANPVLAAYISTDTIEQYSDLTVYYGIYSSNNSVLNTEITLIKNSNEQKQNIEFNRLYSWHIYFDTAGYYDLAVKDVFNHTINFNNILVTEYKGNIPTIDNSLTYLKLNLTTTNRSNTEINREVWEDRGFSSTFENFIWEELNGWLEDENNTNMLRLSSGAKLTIDKPSDGLFTNNAMNDKGYTIELDFKISGVTDFSKPLISCISMANNTIQTGFQITGQTSTLNTEYIKATNSEIREGENDQAYNTRIQGLTTKFIENERIHLTWVIGKNNATYPMIKTYLNGILSGIAEYDTNDRMRENPSDRAKLIFDSTYGIIDIYNIRVYTTDLNSTDVLRNYIATLDTLDDKINKYNDNFGLLDTNSKISVTSIEGGSYSLGIPYIKFTGGEALTKDDEGYALKTSDTTKRLPQYKKDYRLVRQFDFIDPTGVHQDRHLTSTFSDTGYLNGITFYGQGTSSMEYPVKNLRVKFKMKDEQKKKVKFQVNPNDYPVDILTLKADYMESSSSHNTGTANLIFDLLEGNNLHTPGQDYYNLKNPDYKTLTAIRGYPIICFFRTSEEEPFEYIGRYNLNMDKSSEDVFGFLPDPAEEPATPAGIAFGWEAVANTLTNKTEGFANTIHCYEFLNNASNLCNFLSSGNDFETDFYALDSDNIPAWFSSFESRYPEGEAKNGSDVDIKSWFELCKWVNSTATTEATNNTLDEPITYAGITYTEDTADYRLAKFKNEFEEHFDLNFAAFYYVLTNVLLMIDSRAKNMMIATWDNQIWYPIFYDMDTMLGLNNYGYNKFDYNVEDTDANVYNGQNSVLWNNFRVCFLSKIKEMYNKLESTGLNYNGLLNNYNTIQADAWNEILYNEDAEYKYIRPYAEGYVNGIDGKADWVAAGTKNYLYAAQGSRSMHRKYWLQNRLNYFDGKYLSTNYKTDRFIMRLYTPDQGDNYYRVYNVSAEDFNKDTYYIREENNGLYNFIPASTYDNSAEYYKKADNKLNDSVIAVPPNNNFTLTPLYNQYLSVAFGGDNGVTTNPTYVAANTSQILYAPAGSRYNDTETYIYGGSTLKDLGDLSTQYLGLFTFPDKQTKLENLTLGNLNNDYYNPNFSSLTIGNSAPYLKSLNIANCSGLQTSLDLSKCQNLTSVFATGSGLRGIQLPAHGAISELRLPSSLSSLTLIDQPFLEAENFTIGTYDSSTETYSNNDYSSLTQVDIRDVPNLDSYSICLEAENLQDYAFINIDWYPNDNSVEINKINEPYTIKALENLAKLVPIETSPANSLTGTITIPASVDDDIALALYANYWRDYPNLKFNFESTNIVWVNVYDGNGNLYWRRPTKKQQELSYSTFFTNGPNGSLKTPTKESTVEFNYEFKSYALNSPDGQEIDLINNNLYVRNTGIDIYSVFTARRNQYTVRFFNGNVLMSTGEYEYGSSISYIASSLPIPSKDDSDLDIYETYPFKGYSSRSANANVADNLDGIVVNRNVDYYAVFGDKISVNSSENINYNNFSFELKSDGYYAIRPATGVRLSGKVTIPAKYQGIPIHEVSNFNQSFGQGNITGIFFETGSQVIKIASSAFYNDYNLKYFEIPDSLQRIGQEAFLNCSLQLIPKEISNRVKDEFVLGGNSLSVIEAGAFNNGIDDCKILYIGSSITVLEEGAIKYPSKMDSLQQIIIGKPGEPSQLKPVLDNYGNNARPFIFNDNDDAPNLTNINLYLSSNDYNYYEQNSIEVRTWLNPWSNITNIQIEKFSTT